MILMVIRFDFSAFKGKKLLIVNVASKCGYTPQYAELQELYEAHKDQITILAFPANNFGGQEPGTNEDIKSFCSEKLWSYLSHVRKKYLSRE